MEKNVDFRTNFKVLEIGFCCGGRPEVFADALNTEFVRFAEYASGPGTRDKAKREIDLTSSFQFTRPMNKYIKSMADIESRFIHFIDFLKVIKNYDILHFHFNSNLPLYIDFFLYKFMGKKIIIHYRGDDIRNKPYKNCFNFLADWIFVSTPDLLGHTPNRAEWLPNPMDIQTLTYIGTIPHSGPIRIIHPPSHRKKKGTEQIIKAVDNLKEEGYDIEFILIEGKKPIEAIEIYRTADIIIDQINPQIGSYGLVSIEGMALGKPVLCSINPKFHENIKDIPIIHVHTGNLKDQLRMLIEDPLLRQKLGKQGRLYVEKYHDIKKVMEKFWDIIGGHQTNAPPDLME